MAPRSSWKGFIKLSLVSIPVKLYNATSSTSEIRLNQLHAECHNRIKYAKVCPEHGEVPASEIVMGYEYAKDQYAIIDTDEVQKLRPQSDKSINIDTFATPDDIDPLYQTDKKYYIVPDGPVGQKGYALLKAVLEEEGIYGVAQMVLSKKEQLVMIRPLDGVLCLTVLHYAPEVKAAEGFTDDIADVDVSKDELKLTKQLVASAKEFNLEEYRDLYKENLTKLIEAKVEGKEVAEVEHEQPVQTINLMDALKASVEQASGEEKPAQKGKKKMASSARSRKTTKKAKTKTKKSSKKKTG